MTAHLPGLPFPVSAVEKPLGASPIFSLLKSIVVVCAETEIADAKETNRMKEQILNFISLPPFHLGQRRHQNTPEAPNQSNEQRSAKKSKPAEHYTIPNLTLVLKYQGLALSPKVSFVISLNLSIPKSRSLNPFLNNVATFP